MAGIPASTGAVKLRASPR